MNIENRTLEGKLIEVIITTFVNKHIWTQMSNVKEMLQQDLDATLKFYTRVSDVTIQPGEITGTVSFKDTDKIKRSLSFNIKGNAVIEHAS